MNISFIGFGNMAKAIANCLSQKMQIFIKAADPACHAKPTDRLSIYSDNKAVLADADILILAVKPKQMEAVLQEIRQHLAPNCLIISVAAGLNLSWFEQRLDKNRALIRSLPNIAAQVGESATVMVANPHVSDKQRQQAFRVFSSFGLCSWLDDERQMDSYTALSGSGPAYVFYFMEAMIEAAKTLGISDASARQYTLQTFLGAVQLAALHNENPALLRKKVTSEGGTTAAAIAVFDNMDVKKTLASAMQAAYNRAVELGLGENRDS